MESIDWEGASPPAILFPVSVGEQTSHLALGLAMDLVIYIPQARPHLSQMFSWLSQLGRWKPSRIGSLLWSKLDRKGWGVHSRSF